MTVEVSRTIQEEVATFSKRSDDEPIAKSSALSSVVAGEFSRTFPDFGRLGPDGELPQGWSRLFFREFESLSGLRDDGSPQAAGSETLTSFPTRVFGGIEFQFFAPLLCDREAVKSTRLESVRLASSSSGPLVIAVDRSEIHQAGRLCEVVTETSIYKGIGRSPLGEGGAQDLTEHRGISRKFIEIELFRYAAITRNSHRLHYDVSWARGVEGFDDLVVPGPLLSLWMIARAGSRGSLSQATLRFLGPALANRSLVLTQGDSHDIAIYDGDRECVRMRFDLATTEAS